MEQQLNDKHSVTYNKSFEAFWKVKVIWLITVTTTTFLRIATAGSSEQ